MKNIFIILSIILFGCSKYNTIDYNINRMKPPVIIVSKSNPRSDGTILVKLIDAKGKTYTSRDNSLQSKNLYDTVVYFGVKYKNTDKTLSKMKSPVKVIGKSGNTLKLIDKKGHIITINDITLKNYKVGDIIK